MEEIETEKEIDYRNQEFPPSPVCRLGIQESQLLFSGSVMSDSLWHHGLQHARLPCPSPFPGLCSNSNPVSHWCHPTILLSVFPFSPCLQSFPASESFLISLLFTTGGQIIGASASASFLPKKSQGWSPSEWTGWISSKSKGLSRIFSNTTVQNHQFFGAQPYLWSNSHIHHDYWEKKNIALTRQIFVSKVMSLLFNILSRFS